MLATLAPCSRAQSRGDPQESQRRNERDEPVVPSYSDARIFAGLLGVVHFLVLSVCVSAFTAGAVYAVPTSCVNGCSRLVGLRSDAPSYSSSAQSIPRLMAPASSVPELRRVAGPMGSVEPSTRRWDDSVQIGPGQAADQTRSTSTAGYDHDKYRRRGLRGRD